MSENGFIFSRSNRKRSSRSSNPWVSALTAFVPMITEFFQNNRQQTQNDPAESQPTEFFQYLESRRSHESESEERREQNRMDQNIRYDQHSMIVWVVLALLFLGFFIYFSTLRSSPWNSHQYKNEDSMF